MSFGSIYPALTRLEKAGRGGGHRRRVGRPGAGPSARPAAPPTGSLSGELAVLRARRHSPARARRGKKVYRITDAGRQLFAELLAERRRRRRRPQLQRSAWPSPGIWPPRPGWPCSSAAGPCWSSASARPSGASADLDVYARSVVQHTADGVARDISWLDRLIAVRTRRPRRARAEPVPTTDTDHEGDIR